jgi:hypothetical protein
MQINTSVMQINTVAPAEPVEGERAQKVVVVTVRLPQQLVELVDRYRSRLGLSRSDVIRLALAEFFKVGGRDQTGGFGAIRVIGGEGGR